MGAQLRGVDVKFPFEAYPCQVKYMEGVLEALQCSTNALLESPTGTGKTLCLLCASLAWQEAEQEAVEAARADGLLPQAAVGRQVESERSEPKQKPPTIIYSSRTHSQLAKVIQELRMTPYRPRTSVLGSRQQLCVNEKVRGLQGAAQLYGCNSLTSRKMCAPRERVQDYAKGLVESEVGKVMDIEDLLETGNSGHGPCPYFLSKELAKQADLVLLPYNYVLDPGLRHSIGVDWKNSVMIFDEAHNIEELCAESASAECNPNLLSNCHKEVSRSMEPLLDRHEQGDASVATAISDRDTLKALILKLEAQLKFHAEQAGETGKTTSGSEVYIILQNSGMMPADSYDESTLHLIRGQIREAMKDLGDANQRGGSAFSKSGSSNFHLMSLDKFLAKVIESLQPSYDEDRLTGRTGRLVDKYRLHICMDRAKDGDLAPALRFWCFSSAVTLNMLKKECGTRCMVLTSGTLSPLNSFAYELGMPFPVRLENPHVIEASQIFVGILSKGPAGHSLNSSFRNRSDPGYLQDLGNTIANFARIVPDGLLVFFVSFGSMEACLEAWQQPGTGGTPGVMDRIKRHKDVVVEPRQSNRFTEACEDYRMKLQDKSGAVFFAVCSGKASEGLDFSDSAGRAVVITGIPYPPIKDKRISIKKQMLDLQRAHREGKGLSGEEWYTQQATRAVNQALGRVIRHKGDYGAILLCDERYSSPRAQKNISSWLQPHVRTCAGFGEISGALTRFFRHVKDSPLVLEAGPSKRLRETRAIPRNQVQVPKSGTDWKNPFGRSSSAGGGAARPALGSVNARVHQPGAAQFSSQIFISQLQGVPGGRGVAVPPARAGRAPSLVEQLQRMQKPLPPAHGPASDIPGPAMSQAASSGAPPPPPAATGPAHACPPRSKATVGLGELIGRVKAKAVTGPTLALVVRETKRLLMGSLRVTEQDVAAACQAVAACGLDAEQLGAVHDVFRQVAPARAWPDTLRTC